MSHGFVGFRFEEVNLDFAPVLDYDFNLPNVEVTVPGTGQNIKQKYFEIFCGIKIYLDKFKDDDTEAYIQLIKVRELIGYKINEVLIR